MVRAFLTRGVETSTLVSTPIHTGQRPNLGVEGRVEISTLPVVGARDPVALRRQTVVGVKPGVRG